MANLLINLVVINYSGDKKINKTDFIVSFSNKAGLSVMRLLSEAFFQYVDDVLGFAHCVEMYSRHTVSDQVLALHGAPFGTYPVYCLSVTFRLGNLAGKFQRNVYGK